MAATAVRRLEMLGALFCFALILAVCSRIPLRTLALTVWVGALSFGAMIAVPALFLTPGVVIGKLPGLNWQVTEQGMRSCCFLILRVETTATLAALLVLSTPWARILKALRFCRVPVTAVVILGMTYRYIFFFLQTALDMLESRRSRTLGELPGPERRKLASATVGVLLSKSFQLSSDVHLAMLARGFHGEVYLLEEGGLRLADWMMLTVLLAAAALATVLGRM